MADQPDPGDRLPPSPRPESGRKQPGGAPSSHDAVFRRIFGVPANAASQLRAVRGIVIDERSRELIESCTDLDTLNSWFRRSLTIDKASDLFEE